MRLPDRAETFRAPIPLCTMALLTILTFPDPRLHKVATPVAVVDDRIRRHNEPTGGYLDLRHIIQQTRSAL